MDIFIKPPNKNIKIIDKIKNINKINDINNIFDLFTKYNLDKKNSNLIVKKYNKDNNKIEISDTKEYELLNDIINNNKDLLTIDKNINESREGNIIMYGYKKCLLENNYINFELNELLNNIKYNISYRINKQEDLFFCFKKLNYYKNSIDNRFFYYGTLIIFYNKIEINRIPLYNDLLKNIYIYTERIIYDRYLSFVNINKGFLFFEYDKIQNKMLLFYYYNNDIIKYNIIDELCCYTEFESYLNDKYLDKLKYLEENIN